MVSATQLKRPQWWGIGRWMQQPLNRMNRKAASYRYRSFIAGQLPTTSGRSGHRDTVERRLRTSTVPGLIDAEEG